MVKSIQRYAFSAALIGNVFLSYAQPAVLKATKPNIILILADDLGYGDLSCYGSQSVETPYIDSLASKGMRFTRFYSGSAVCTPARASILTGKYPIRFNITKHFSDSLEYLPTESMTIADLLKRAGYETAHIGKWHLGGIRAEDVKQRNLGKPALPGPAQHGFDYFLVDIEGSVRKELVRSRTLYRNGGKHMIRNDEFAPEDTLNWDRIKTEEAKRLMERYKQEGKPFFINLWYDAPHTPYEPMPEPHLSKYKAMGVEGDQLYFRSMVSHLDENIGMIMQRLKELDLYENTIIIFSSDNGPAYQGSPGPFKGSKTDLHEGGIRVPFIAVWPKHIPANTISFTTGHFADILPTFCEIAGIKNFPSDIDGQSILPVLNNQSDSYIERDGFLFWQIFKYPQIQGQAPRPLPHVTEAVTKGNWKLTAVEKVPKELFNLAQDSRELKNLLGQYPTVEKELLDYLEKVYDEPRLKWNERLGVY